MRHADDKKSYPSHLTTLSINIGSTLSKSIPCINKSDLGSMGDIVMESIYLQPVTCEEISKLFVGLKNTAFGLDGIGAISFKISSRFITQPLALLCNESTTKGVFPNQLKLTNFIPLYKADDQMLFSYYQTVSLLCGISQVIEKVMYTGLLDFLENSK